MASAISINKYIRKFLTENEEVTSLVKSANIKHLVLKPTSFPFITYMYDGIETEYTKDGPATDSVSVLIAIVDDSNERATDIAEAVRKTLEWKSYKDADIDIKDIIIDGIYEDFVENRYVVKIIVKFHIALD